MNFYEKLNYTKLLETQVYCVIKQFEFTYEIPKSDYVMRFWCISLENYDFEFQKNIELWIIYFDFASVKGRSW